MRPRNLFTLPGGGCPAWLITAFFLLAWFTGGARDRYPLLGLVLTLLALAILSGEAGRIRFVAQKPALRALLLVFAAGFVLAIIQLIPLPPAVWHQLAGRATAADLYRNLQWAREWRPLSLTPDATVRGVLAMLAPLAAFLAVAGMSAAHRIRLLRMTIAAAAIGAGFGALQAAVGESAWVLYDTAHRGFGVGFFVNRNHQATFLLACAVLAAVPGVLVLRDENARAGRGWAPLALPLAGTAFLAVGVLATASRMGLVLLPPALFAALAVAARGYRARWIVAGGALATLAVAALTRTDLLQRSLQRFAAASDDLRYQYWHNTLYAIREVLPWGTGLGSFDPVYRAIEPLGQVRPLYVNHAHNDYLEVALEGGWPAMAVVALGLAAIAFAVATAWRTGAAGARPLVLACAGGIVLILLFTIVDYPLRSAAVGCLFAMMLGLLAPPPPEARPAPADAPQRFVGRAAVAAVALVAAGLSVSAAAGESLRLAGQPALATRAAPWSSEAWADRATREQAAGELGASRQSAERALRIAPLTAAAVRVHGLADLLLDRPDRGIATMQLGAALGWRDSGLQLWLAEAGLATGDATLAAERLDALLRRGASAGRAMERLRQLYRQPPDGPEAIAVRLTDEPAWRAGFFNLTAPDAAASVPRALNFLARLDQLGVPASPGETALWRWRLAESGAFREARQIWLASGGKGWLADGGFEDPQGIPAGAAAPFAWGAPALPGVTVARAEADDRDHMAVQISAPGSSAGPVLTQTIVLAPGTYALGSKLRSVTGGELAAGWTIGCADGPPTARAIDLRWADAADSWRTANGTFTVTGDCVALVLALRLANDSAERRLLQVDDVTLERLPGGER